MPWLSWLGELARGPALGSVQMFAAAGRHTSSFLDAHHFALEGGVTSRELQCLVVEHGLVGRDGARLSLEPCATAVLRGDGREIFDLQAGGQLHSSLGDKCVALADAAEQAGRQHPLSLRPCDSRDWHQLSWHLTPDSRWQVDGEAEEDTGGGSDSQGGAPAWRDDVSRREGLCLSLAGSGAPGERDIAPEATASASSTVDAAQHGAALAIDGSDATYWASAADPEAPVTLEAKLASPQRLSAVDIDWECPARDFAVQTRDAAGAWAERSVHTWNASDRTHVPLAGGEVSAVRIVMYGPAPPCGWGGPAGPRAFAIRQLALRAPRLQPVVEPCDDAQRSGDARDRWFLHAIREFDPSQRLLRQSARAAFF